MSGLAEALMCDTAMQREKIVKQLRSQSLPEAMPLGFQFRIALKSALSPNWA